MRWHFLQIIILTVEPQYDREVSLTNQLGQYLGTHDGRRVSSS